MTKKINFLNGLILSTLAPFALFSASMDSRIDQLEKTVAASTTTNPMGTTGAKNASAYAPLENMEGWHLQLGFIYEQPRVEGSGFAVKQNVATTTKTTEEIQTQDFKWGWGLLFSAGYRFAREWDVSLDYMYFDKSQSMLVDVGNGFGSVILPTRAKFNIVSDSSLLTQVTKAKSDYSIELNSFDVSVGNIYFMQRYFSTGFKAGLRNQWLSLKQNIAYSGGTVLGNNSVYVDDTSRFWGMGPVGTIVNDWVLGKGFSIYSNTALSMLYAKFKVNQNQKYSNDAGRNFFTTDNRGMIIPELDVNLGLKYARFFGRKDQHYLALRLGWDFHYLFRVNQILMNMDSYTGSNSLSQQRRTPNSSEDMAMQGLMCDLRWDF